MARLNRVFEDHNSVASLWYLHRCDPKRVESDLDVPKLKEFSRRLKTSCDTTFSHIDKMTVGDPNRPYREAAITYDAIQDAAESVWRTLARLQLRESLEVQSFGIDGSGVAGMFAAPAFGLV
jgi:hypothetical protein